MARYTREDILRIVEEEDVEFVRLQFTDIFGTFKNIAITVNNLEKALDNNYMFDASAFYGFVDDDETDMYLYPDLNTFTIFPWRPQQGKVARLICDIYKTDRTPLNTDPRYVLKSVLSKCKEMGYTFDVGPECQFYLFHTDEIGRPTTVSHERAGYFDIGPTDLGENIRRDIVLTLLDMGFDIDSSHHECDRSQHEVDFKYGQALETADNIMTFKLAVKTIAKKHGLYATFMPKPLNEGNGSGMHMNLSLSEIDEIGLKSRNAFNNADDVNGLSDVAYYFIGGVLKHIKAITLLTNPYVNSYKRLSAGGQAPAEIGWKKGGKKQIIRIPHNNGEHARIEVRNPDSTCNPYIAFAILLAAGLEGIKNQISPDSVKYENNKLPMNLYEAISEYKNDAFVKRVLGEELYNRILSAKEKEWEEFSSYVTDFEIDKLLARY